MYPRVHTQLDLLYTWIHGVPYVSVYCNKSTKMTTLMFHAIYYTKRFI